MGSKNKLKRFKDNDNFENVFQPSRDEVIGSFFSLKGKWNSDFFNNNNPIIIELGCGKGEYCIGLAARFPEKNFVGIDIKGARFWRGAKTATETGLTNVAFVGQKFDGTACSIILENALNLDKVSIDFKEKDEEGSNEYDPNAARKLKGPAISVKKFPGQN